MERQDRSGPGIDREQTERPRRETDRLTTQTDLTDRPTDKETVVFFLFICCASLFLFFTPLFFSFSSAHLSLFFLFSPPPFVIALSSIHSFIHSFIAAVFLFLFLFSSSLLARAHSFFSPRAFLHCAHLAGSDVPPILHWPDTRSLYLSLSFSVISCPSFLPFLSSIHS